MRNLVTVSVVIFAALLTSGPAVFAQKPGLEVPVVTPGPGWKSCPRCENDAHVADDRKKASVDTRAFDAHDISGVWGNSGIFIDFKARPPFTPEGQKLYDALAKRVDQPDYNTVAANDPLLFCDPLGGVRAFGYNYGTELVQLPNRVLQFFEWGHTWRTIWTDGRKLPTDPPISRFMGYSVGHWEGDTFIVESGGIDERALLGADATKPVFPHGADMKVVETYKRLDYGKLQATLTIIDPKIYTKSWVTTGTALLLPDAELGEDFCVPSDSNEFNTRQTIPAGGDPNKRR